MNDRGLRYYIVTGQATIFVTLIITALLWAAAGMSEPLARAAGFLVTGATGFGLYELNNRNALLRIRSMMISSTFVMLAGTLPFLHSISFDYVPMLCWGAAYLVYFQCYQSYHAQGAIFHVFMFLSLAALVFPQMLLLAPLFLFTTVVQMRALTLRAFAAALLGLALPFALREAYLFFTLSGTKIYDFRDQLTAFSVPDYTVLDEHRLVSFAVVALLAVVAVAHFARTKFNDKIRTRMLYYIILIQEFALAALLALRPDAFDVLFRVFVLNSAPLIAHNLAFVRGRSGNVYFFAVLILLGLLAFYNIADINLGIWEMLRNS